ncbi:C163A protein, partial [Anhinga anhinga]|nr:C163A protein [Anhinga anhinga]
EGSGPTWLYRVNCRGDESTLWNCSHRGWGVFTCPHYFDTGVICSGADELRLSNGTGPCSGRVEVKHEEQWGTVCDGDWTIEDAEVVCKQLQCGSAVQALNRALFGEGSGPTWLYRVNCRGDESTLWNCSHRGWGVFTCPHYFDTGVICS